MFSPPFLLKFENSEPPLVLNMGLPMPGCLIEVTRKFDSESAIIGSYELVIVHRRIFERQQRELTE